jgi:hypothetical protein
MIAQAKDLQQEGLDPTPFGGGDAPKGGGEPTAANCGAARGAKTPTGGGLPNSPRGGGDVPSATPGNGGGAPTNKVAPAIVQNIVGNAFRLSGNKPNSFLL